LLGKINISTNRFKLLLIQIFITLLAIAPVMAHSFTLSDTAKAQIKQKYGQAGLKRVNAWVKLINENQNTNEIKKLRLVTDFFHQNKSISDEDLWKKVNYWATPVELLGMGGGDCEDFVIAKYFTLKEMGVSVKKLRFIYVTSAKLKNPHMILAYYEYPDADPFILDNMTRWILYGSERPDLKPVYSFNGEYLWYIVKSKEKKVGNVSGFSQWQDLKNRMREEQMPKGMIK